MITLSILSLFIIGGAHGVMNYKPDHGELKQLNLDGNLLANLKWSDGSQTNVQMFAPNPEALEFCMYRGSFPKDEGSKILG